MTAPSQSPGPITLTAFGLAVLLGGSNFVAVSISNEELPPFWGAALRFGMAALLFLAIAAALRLEWPRGRQLLLTAAYGILSFAVSYALMYWALVQVTAGMGAVVLAVVPLLTPLLAAAQGLESLNRRALVGAFIALAGIVWMTVGPSGLILPIGGMIAMLAATISISEGVIVSKMVSDNHPVMNNAVGMLAGAPFLFVLSAVAGESWILPSQPKVIGAVVYLVTLGSVGLFVSFLTVIRRWTASATAYAFVLFPVVAMLLEAWIEDVPLTVRGTTGALIVMSGVWIGAFAPSRNALPRARAARETAATR